MNCEDVSVILDTRGEEKLRAAERCAVDAHLASCAECAAAWHAQSALRSLTIPALPEGLLHRVLTARAGSRPTRRRVSRVTLGAAVAAAGAALAAVSYVELREHAGAEAAAGAAAPLPTIGADAIAPADLRPSGAPGSAPQDAPRAAGDGPDSEYFLISRAAPVYPKAALELGLDGEAHLKFTVTKEGSVADISVVRATDDAFAAAAVDALSKWRYLPRIANGRRVDVPGNQTVIRFAMTAPPPPSTPPARPPQRLSPQLYAEIERRLDAAWKCAATDELRCAELILDELVASHELTPDKAPQVWTFYGWIFMQYGDYGRAIAALEQAVPQYGWSGQWTALASLYFARNQYDLALQTLLRGKAASTSGQMPLGAQPLLEKLRALGITEDVL